MNILVIRLSSLGDIILTAPLIKSLRQTYPDAQIDYCTKAEYAEVLRFNPNINNIIEADDNLTFSKLCSLKKILKHEQYDIVIDAHNKFNTFYLRLFLGRKTLKFKKYSFRKFLLVNFKINLMKNLPPITERYCNILIPLLRGVDVRHMPDSRGVLSEIYTDLYSQSQVEGLLIDIHLTDKKLICIVPSSKHFTKTYPTELYAELINKFDKDKYSFALAGKGKDKINIDIIKSKTGNNVFDLCDKLNTLELFELIKKCRLVISGDTGHMHIAEAAGVPIIMLAGSSVREFGFYPLLQNAVILENNKLNCRPCSHIGRKSCPKMHFKCMREITPEEIKNAAESLLLVQK